MRKLFFVLLSVVMVFMNACSIATENATTPVTETSEVALSEEEIYHNFLTKLYKKLNAIIGDDTHLDGFSLQEGMVGVAEIASLSRTEVLKKIGYTTMDITGDSVPELLICAIDELTDTNGKGSRILCVFTAAENTTQLLCAGDLLNSYYLLDDNTLYNASSDGALTVTEHIRFLELMPIEWFYN